MIGIWYSFKNDQLCLEQSVRSFRASYPNACIVICDDQKNPCDPDLIKKIDPQEYHQRSWDSLGNLNGWQCVRQMMLMQCELHDLYPLAQGSCKVDCDTIITDSSWHDHSSIASGLDIGTDSVMTGCVRYMRKDAPAAVLDFINSRWRWETYPVPEDRAIAAMCLQLWGASVEIIPWHQVAKSYSYKEDPDQSQKAKVLCFGNRDNIKSTHELSARDYAAAMMKRQLDLYDEIT